ncbi:MAG: general secretion pathway protein GspF [Gammaproteobacteria bacterium]|nr:general secretion pathway protein GspF [Gammaproteobacteria bacterium]
MIIKKKPRKHHLLDEPILHENHKRPVTRREFLGAGLVSGGAMVMGNSLLSALAANPALAASIEDCGLDSRGAGKIPFIAFDLGGGANIAGSNVLVGGPQGQFDLLSTAGYSKMGVPGDMVPGLTETNPSNTSNGDYTDTSFGLAFHSDSAFLRGMLAVTSQATRDGTNGCVIPARSDNDTGNNPHNPMYGIYKAGADGELLSLIGSRSSDSGGRSMAPASMIDLSVRPTKIDRPGDVTGLVDTGGLVGLLSQTDSVAVMDAVERISKAKLGISGSGSINSTAETNQQMHCSYLATTANIRDYGDPAALDPLQDPDVTGLFGDTGSLPVDGVTASLNNSYFAKVASVMKMCIDGRAGAGTIEQGGYDYHDGTRATGEIRDLRAGIGMGMCLEYARLKNKQLMLYVFSDGSVASNGRIDDSVDGRGKGEWTGDNSSTAASFFLVYNPGSAPVLLGADNAEKARHQQLGHFRASGSVETSSTTPGSNNVNLLVEMVVLNYMALHGNGNSTALTSALGSHSLGSNLERLIAFNSIR